MTLWQYKESIIFQAHYKKAEEKEISEKRRKQGSKRNMIIHA